MLLGGFGFLSRMHGLSIDNLVEVEMVLADGRIVIVNENEHPGMRHPLPHISILMTDYIYVLSPAPQICGGPSEVVGLLSESRLDTRPKPSQFQSSSRETLFSE